MKKVFLIASLVSGMAVSAQTVSKKVTLTKGQQLEQSSQVNMLITQEAMGQVMEIKMESSLINLFEVKDNSATGYSVANTLKKVLMNMNAMGQEMKFDSDKKEDLDGQLGEAYRDKINKPNEYTLNKEGVITEIKNKPAETKDASGGGMMGNMMNGTVGEEKEGAVFNAIANIPAAGVKVGDSWKDSTNEDGNSSVTNYRLKEVKGDEGVVEVESDMALSRELEQQGMTMQLEMKGKTTGEYTFDVNTGLIKSRKATTKAAGTVEVAGQSVPMTVETTVTSSVSKK